MSAQTTYSINHAKAYEGQLADLNYNRDTISEPAGGDVPFGVVVSRSATTREVTVGGDASGIGISIRSLDHENGAGNVDPKYVDGDSVGILREGYIYVAVTNTGNIGSLLRYDDATGAIEIGAADTGKTVIPGAKTEEIVTTTGDITKIRLPSSAFDTLT